VMMDKLEGGQSVANYVVTVRPLLWCLLRAAPGSHGHRAARGRRAAVDESRLVVRLGGQTGVGRGILWAVRQW
jgi:hypothetical protein